MPVAALRDEDDRVGDRPIGGSYIVTSHACDPAPMNDFVDECLSPFSSRPGNGASSPPCHLLQALLLLIL